MQVSSLQEAFLTVYGWDMYYVLYILFMMSGIFLYPVLRVANDVYISYVSGSEYAGTNHLRQLLVSLGLAVLVYFIAVVPMMSINLKKTTIKSVCAQITDVTKYNSNSYFNNTSTSVPLMPYFSMSVAQGINNVIYTQKKACLVDITNAHKATMAVDLGQAKDPQLLNSELNRFVAECHNQARNKLNEIMNNVYTEKVADLFKQRLDIAITARVSSTGNKDRKAHEIYLMNNYDSPLIRTLFYSNISPLKLLPETKGIAPLLANRSVKNVAGTGNGSQKQGSETPPSCGEWWSGNNGLRARLINAMSDSVAVNMANDLGIKACRNDIIQPIKDGGNGMSAARKKSCAAAVKKAAYDGNQEKFVSEMFIAMQGGVTDSPLTTADNVKLTATTGAMVISQIPLISKFLGGADEIGAAAISQITGFYMTVFLLKLMLKYFIPMILMAVYMFWGIYMVVGEFKGMVMIKGMILIIALSMMPALWAIMEYLDDALYDAMYGSISVSDVFNMALLDITTGIFQITIVFVLFYLIGEAGGGNARGAVGDAQGFGNTAASGAGGSAGRSIGGVAGGATRGAGSFGKKWGTNTWNKLKPKPKYKIGPY